MSDPFDSPATGADGIDPADRMIRNRAAKSLILNGIAPIVVGLFSCMCNPFYIFTVLTVVAAISAFTVPGQMRRRLGEPQLFPETAATASYILGATGLVIAALPFLVGVLSILAAGMG